MKKKIVLFAVLILAIAYFPAVAQSGCTCDSGCGSVQNVTTDFTQDGSGTYCFFLPCIGDYVNSWNMATVEINGQDFTNKWASASSLPSTIDGGYYVYYVGNYGWSHFEAKGACSGGPTDPPITPEPGTATPTPGGEPGVGDVSMVPSSVTVQQVNDPVSFEIHVNSGTQRVAAYGIDISYNSSILSIGSDEDVVEGSQGFVSAVNINDAGIIKTSGFDSSGTGPGSDLHLLTVNMTAIGEGTSNIGITVNDLADDDTNTIGNPNGIGGTVTVQGGVTATPTTTTATPTPTGTPAQGVGDVSMVPSSVTVQQVNDPVSFEIHVNSGTQELAAYGINITYDASILSIGSDEDVVEGSEGFVSAVNINDAGIIKTSGFDTGGTGPGADLHLLTVNMTAVGSGTSQIGIEVDSLADPDTETIGSPNGIGGSVTVEGGVTATPTTTTATPTSSPTPAQGVGDVSMVPSSITVQQVNDPVSFEIHVNSGTQELAAYGINITYDAGILSIGSDEDVVEGSEGFVSAVNINDAGIIKTSGFDTGGKGPGADLHLLTVNMTAIGSGTSQIGIEVDSLADPDTETIGSPNGIGGSVTVEGGVTATPTTATATPTPATPTPGTGTGCTCDSGCDSVQNISTDFTQNGSGTYCWFIPCVGSYINSWNLQTLEVNGQDFTNKWASASSLPATIDGGYYIYYVGNYGWAHFEAKGACSGTVTDPPPTDPPPTDPPPTETPTTVTETPTPQITDPPTATPTPTQGEYPEWSSSQFYRQGDKVSYQGVNYECITWWSWGQVPPDNPNAWQVIGETPTDPPPTDPPPTETPTTVTETPSPTPQVTAEPGVGDVSMVPDSVSAQRGQPFSFEIHVNSGDSKLAAYGIDITYDSGIISIGSDEDVVEGSEGFVSAVNINDPGVIRTSGFDTGGTGPGLDLHLLTVNMSADTVGTSQIGISVDSLADPDTVTIGVPNGIGGSVTVTDSATATPVVTAVPTATPVVTAVPTETPVVTAVPTETPVVTAVPTATPAQKTAGSVWIDPASQSVSLGSSVVYQVHVHTGSQDLAAYGIDIYYDSGILSITDDDNVEEGADGFIAAVNVGTAGKIVTSGFDTGGEGPGDNLHLLTITMDTVGRGTSSLDIDVRSLADSDTETVGNPNGISGSVTVN